MKTFFGIHAVAVNKDGEYLLLQRANHRKRPGEWNVVTGHVQDRESAEEAALRELKEEANLEGEIVKTAEPFWVELDDGRWVIVSSLIQVRDISAFKVDPQESQSYRWVKADDLLVLQVKSLHESFKQLGII